MINISFMLLEAINNFQHNLNNYNNKRLHILIYKLFKQSLIKAVKTHFIYCPPLKKSLFSVQNTLKAI